jgi:uncharacterized protein (TIGR02391 family)
VTARRLLEIVPVPDALLDLTPDELAWAVLEDMQARERDPIAGMANRESLANSFTPMSFRPNPQQHEVMNRINKAGRSAIGLLERWELIEPAADMNGRNGYVVLTGKGRGTTERTDFERVRVRGLLRSEMLHPLLRGKPYDDFVADHLDAAVLEAFKTIEVEVRTAAARPDGEHGKDLMFRAFVMNGPLAKAGETKAECEALAGLFAGALARFRNPGAHTRRSFTDVLEAIEELMVASRLLRIVDERRQALATNKPKGAPPQGCL